MKVVQNVHLGLVGDKNKMEFNSSIDMINIGTVMKLRDFERYNDFFLSLSECKDWVSSDIKSYRYNYSIKVGDSSYYIGYWHNSEKKTNKHNLKIEFNPNKVNYWEHDVLRQLLQYCLLHDTFSKIRSFDVAFDLLDLPYCNLVVDKGNKHNVNIYKGTYYIGSRENGVKIYDKQKEANLSYCCSRYEVRSSVDVNLFSVDSLNLNNTVYPALYYITDTLPVDPFDRVVILGLIQDPVAINSFSRRKKEKYKQLLAQYENFKPCGDMITSTLRQFINTMKFALIGA